MPSAVFCFFLQSLPALHIPGLISDYTSNLLTRFYHQKAQILWTPEDKRQLRDFSGISNIHAACYPDRKDDMALDSELKQTHQGIGRALWFTGILLPRGKYSHPMTRALPRAACIYCTKRSGGQRTRHITEIRGKTELVTCGRGLRKRRMKVEDDRVEVTNAKRSPLILNSNSSTQGYVPTTSSKIPTRLPGVGGCEDV